jgi:transcriptional regulator with XRE-family HTH domain
MDLRIARRIAGLTQLELATKVGVDDSFISLLESGKRDIRTTEYRTVVRLARALNVTPEELFPIATEDEDLRTPKGSAAVCPSTK